MGRQKRDVISDTIQRVLSETHTIIRITRIVELCNSVRTAVANGEDIEIAARRIVPTFAELP